MQPAMMRITWGTLRPALLILAVCTGSRALAIEEPAYRSLEQDGSFELREYPAHLVAETVVAAGFEEAGNVAFGRLFRYISGENAGRSKIAMTAPVTQAKGEKIAMTAPVAQQAEGRGYRVAFVVPAQYTKDTVPTPLDPEVRIREVPAQLIACWRYSGRWTRENYDSSERTLRGQLASRGLEARGEPVLARYNPPFTPWFMRRNEVLIPVERRAKGP